MSGPQSMTDPAAPGGRRAALEALGVGLCALGVLAWPSLLGSEVLVGSPLGETDNHLWMFWRELTALPRPVTNLPRGVPLPLMDPTNLPLYALGGVVSPVAGWWTLRLGNLILALIGGYALSRCVAGHRGALVGMVALGAAPMLAGMFDFGITESWPVGWMALHAAALLQLARTGRPWLGVAAGTTLGLVALSGWYFAFFGLVLEAVLVPILLWRHRRLALLLQGALALALVLPRFVAFQAIQGHWRPRWMLPSPTPPPWREDWADVTPRGTDLLNLVLPHPEVLHPGKSSYLGLVVLALAGLGVWRKPRVAGPLVLAAVPFCVFALGYWPTVAGHPIGVRGAPWLLLQASDSVLGLTHWDRALVGALPFVAAAAAVGVDALPRLARIAPLLAGLVLADSVFLSGVAWPRTAYPAGVPSGLRQLDGPGGVVQLPFDNGRKPFSDEPPRLYNRWQAFVDRPVSENYEAVDDLLLDSDLVAAAHGRCRQRATLPLSMLPPRERLRRPVPTGTALEAEITALQQRGYAFIYLHADRCPKPGAVTALLDKALGPGQPLAGGDRVWRLGR